MKETFENIALEALLGSFMPTRLDMRLFGTGETFTADSVTKGNLATLVHETFHFYQTIFQRIWSHFMGLSPPSN